MKTLQRLDYDLGIAGMNAFNAGGRLHRQRCDTRRAEEAMGREHGEVGRDSGTRRGIESGNGQQRLHSARLHATRGAIFGSGLPDLSLACKLMKSCIFLSPFDLQPPAWDNTCMTSERKPTQSALHFLSSCRPSEILRTTAVRFTLLATIFGCTSAAIAGDHEKVSATSTPASSATARIKQWFETGQASWYGLKFQGRKTATGEKFDMNTFTCAHRSLPLGSWLRVTNLHNRKTVLVRVNDRGPMVGSRIVDLSYAAARAVGLGGTSKVKLERVSPADPEIARILLAQMTPLPFAQLLPAR